MPLLGFSLSDVVILLFVLVPGYIAFTLVSRVGKTDIGEDRLDKIIIISFTGIFCDAIFITAYLFLNNSEITRDLVNIESYTLFQIAQAYIALVFVAVFLGLISGIAVDRIYLRTSQRTRDDVWDTAFDFANTNSMEGSVEVIVLTDNKFEVHGYVRARGTSDNMHDILVEYPTIITRENEDMHEDLDIGRRVYINLDRISHVFFVAKE